jgi:hypothetical protein
MATDNSVHPSSDDANAKMPSTKRMEWTIGGWKNSKHLAKRFAFFLISWIGTAILVCYGLALSLSFVDHTLNFIKTFRQYSLMVLIVPLILIFLLNKFIPILDHLASKAETSNKTGSLPNDKLD